MITMHVGGQSYHGNISQPLLSTQAKSAPRQRGTNFGNFLFCGLLGNKVVGWITNVLLWILLVGTVGGITMTIIGGVTLTNGGSPLFGAGLPICIISFTFLIFCILLYIANCLACDIFRYQTSMSDAVNVYQKVKDIISAPPSIVFTVTCYHMETRTRTVHTRGHNGQMVPRTETYSVPVTTYTESADFPVCRWNDISERFDLYYTRKKFAKIQLYKEYILADEQTQLAHEYIQTEMLERNRYRDTNISISTAFSIPGYFSDKILAVMNPDIRSPMFSAKHFMLFSLLGFSMLYRVYAERFCTDQEQEFTVVKAVSVLPASQ